MHWLLVGYMYLFIHRPFEIWPWLGDLRVERVYMLVTLAFWLVAAPKRVLPNVQHFAYGMFAFAVVACWAMSPWADKTQPVVEDWLKILVFYVLLVTTVYDERGLKRMAVGFIAVMGLYISHSFREFIAGRHVYRMGIMRLIGVDETLGDPNSFGASIVFALPFVAALWKADVGGRRGKFLLAGYTGLSVLCVLLTGSRSSLLGMAAWAGLVMLGGKQKKRVFLWGCALAALAPAGFFLLPADLQTRFETIINPEAGPANAQESGQGRINGFYTGFDLLAANPLTGVGPGAWRPATRSPIESHNLYGQLLGETGTFGAIGFVAILFGFWSNLRRVKTIRRAFPEWENDLVFQVASAAGTTVLLLLFMGNFGHNLFRFTWLWYGGFLIIARYCIEQRLAELESAPPEWDEGSEDESAPEPASDQLPEGWVQHTGHDPVYTQEPEPAQHPFR
jgi:O-antigen ligase